MSLMAVHSVLPDSRLSAYQVQQKFHQSHLSGTPSFDLMLRRRSAYRYGISGLGQVCGEDGICVDDAGNIIGTVDPTSGGYQPILTDATSMPGVTPPMGPLPAQITLPSGQRVSTADNAQLYAALAQAGIDVAKLAIIQPGTSQAGGSITRQNPGYPVAPIATSSQTGINANVSTGAGLAFSSVALIGIGLVALISLTGRRGH